MVAGIMMPHERCHYLQDLHSEWHLLLGSVGVLRLETRYRRDCVGLLRREILCLRGNESLIQLSTRAAKIVLGTKVRQIRMIILLGQVDYVAITQARIFY